MANPVQIGVQWGKKVGRYSADITGYMLFKFCCKLLIFFLRYNYYTYIVCIIVSVECVIVYAMHVWLVVSYIYIYIYIYIIRTTYISLCYLYLIENVNHVVFAVTISASAIENDQLL